MEDEDRLGMTPEQWAIFKKHTQGYGDQDENGIDLTTLRENLKLTPTQRLDKMLRQLTFFEGVDHARTVRHHSNR